MPVYEYECSLCDCHFERRQRFDEEPVAVCPICQGRARRVIHSIPVIFKGSGFYITDSRQEKSSPTTAEKPEAKGKKEEKEKKE